MPWMWLIAGPNGAGKTSFRRPFLTEIGLPGLRQLNADDLTAAMRAGDPDAPQDELNLVAAQEIDRQVAACIAAGESFLVETVLSSGKYRDDVEAAKVAGYKIGMVFISLHPPELSPLRVSERVLKGGHHVDRDRAMARYERSHKELAWFAKHSDLLLVFDNSAPDGKPVLLLSRTGQKTIFVRRGLNPAIDEALSEIDGGL